MYQAKPRGLVVTGALIVRRSTRLALYKDLGAGLSGIALELAIRFASLECSKAGLADDNMDLGGICVGECSHRISGE